MPAEEERELGKYGEEKISWDGNMQTRLLPCLGFERVHPVPGCRYQTRPVLFFCPRAIHVMRAPRRWDEVRHQTVSLLAAFLSAGQETPAPVDLQNFVAFQDGFDKLFKVAGEVRRMPRAKTKKNNAICPDGEPFVFLFLLGRRRGRCCCYCCRCCWVFFCVAFRGRPQTWFDISFFSRILFFLNS